MNSLEQQLSYPFGEVLPELGATLEVAPGVRWVRMHLPFQLNHVNLWLLRDEQEGREGWSIVDCGIDNAATRSAWESVFAHGLDGLPVLRVLATHMHPDHIGLAHWLTARWNARLWVSATDFATARLISAAPASHGGAGTADFMASHGLTDPAAQAGLRARGNTYAQMVPQLPTQYHRLLDGQPLSVGNRTWYGLAGHGHAPEHIALHRPEPGGPGVLISGDMLLPRISTNVSVHESEPESNPLALYLASLQRLRDLPDDTLVLPSHGRPFRGLRTRIDQLVAHHDERLAEVRAACAQAPQHAAGLLLLLFKRPLDLHQTGFAMGESLAHLHALWHAGELRRERGADGVFRFRAA